MHLQPIKIVNPGLRIIILLFGLVSTFVPVNSAQNQNVTSSFNIPSESAERNEVEIELSISCGYDYVKDNMDLEVLPITDSLKKSITLIFRVPPLYEKCFSYYEIDLRKERETVDSFRVSSSEKSHCFENLKSGTYFFWVEPCYAKDNCSSIVFQTSNINITVSEPQASANKDEEKFGLGMHLLITAISLSIMSLFFAAVYIFSKRVREWREVEYGDSYVEVVVDIDESGSISKKIRIFILSSREIEVKCQVLILKDFLEKSGHFDVALLDDEMESILIDRYSWLRDILKYECSNLGDHGNSDTKIIFVESKNYSCESCYDAMKMDEIEEDIYYEAVTTLGIDWARCLKDYCHLFVVRFDDFVSSNSDLTNIAPRNRYKIPEHLVTLSCNLMSCDKTSSIMREKFMKYLEAHPIKYLGMEGKAWISPK